MPKIANTSLNGEEKCLVAIPDAAPVLIAVIESPSSLASKFPFFESNTRTEESTILSFLIDDWSKTVTTFMTKYFPSFL